jgi:hypothetical protein
MATKAQVVLDHLFEALEAISSSTGLPASLNGHRQKAMPRDLWLHSDRERSRTKGTVLIIRVKEDSTAEQLATYLAFEFLRATE